MVQLMPLPLRHLLLQWSTDRFSLSGADLPSLSWNKMPVNRCLVICEILLLLFKVRTDPGKVWIVVEFKVEIFQALKSLESDQRYGKIWKNPWKLRGWPGNYSFSLHWLILHHAFVMLLSLYVADILWSEFQYHIDIGKDDIDPFRQWNFVVKGTFNEFRWCIWR